MTDPGLPFDHAQTHATLPEATEPQLPRPLQALGMQEHWGDPWHEEGSGMQNGGGGSHGFGMQPGPGATPGHDLTAVVPVGHAPLSGIGVHRGAFPPQQGSTQISPAPQVCGPHATGAPASPASTGGDGSSPEASMKHAYPGQPPMLHVPG